MSLKRTSFLLTLLLLLGAASCATYKQRRIDIHPVGEYPNMSTAEGISVAADPYDSTEKAKQGFYMDVTRKGFFPVNLIFKNDTNERVRVLRETIELIDENGVIYRPVSGKAMSNKFKKNAVARLLGGSVISVAIGVVSYVSAILANRKMKADWRRKEISDQLIIPPGRKMNRFVYFKLPEGKTTRVSKLCLESERLNTGGVIHLEVTPRKNGSTITFYPAEDKNPPNQASTEPTR